LCGIFGCVMPTDDVAPIIHSALKRLEYRGYDSVGIATLFSAGLQIKKDQGKIDDVHERLDLNDLNGFIGIGHTRWATHGAPLMVNAHPHTDCEGTIAVVHNGIIENFGELKEELVSKGHVIASRTDTEVIPHLIEDNIKQGQDLTESIRNALERLEGSYALAILATQEPNRIFFARNESPLVIGASDHGTYISSDIPTLLPLTRQILDLHNGEYGNIALGTVTLQNIRDDAIITRPFRTIDWTIEMAQKQGYPHFMLKEIHEQPRALQDVLRLQQRYIDLITTFLDRSKEIYLLACGTSYNACLAASYMFSNLCNMATHPIIASEFIDQFGDAVNIESTILAVSQSGETADTLRSIDHARFRAATILGLTNTIGSSITRVSRAYICQQSGPEIGVAATKTFTAQLLVLAQIGLGLAKLRGKVSQDRIDELQLQLQGIPNLVQTVIDTQQEKVHQLAQKYRNASCFYFLGRGISTATAYEGRLKLLELAYIPSIAYPAGESKHGPISLIEPGFPVIFICPPDNTRKGLIGNIMEMKARGANIIAIVDVQDDEIKKLADDYIEIPSGIHSLLSPIPYSLPLQLIAYYMAVNRKCDPDKPRNLAKSVTVL
jgi:glucosamine--fructose-6-phosphate aminotransferase (isomerizing)